MVRTADIEALLEVERETLEALGQSRPMTAEIRARVEEMKRRAPEAFYSNVVLALTGRSLSEAEARDDWAAILAHKYDLSRRVGRDVGLQVAALDFYKNVRKVADDVRLVPTDLLSNALLASIHDPLTGLYNHRYLQEELGRALRRAAKRGEPVGLLFGDLDHFKAYNDAHGHLAGDVLLWEAARILYENFRDGVDVPCRYGGDEFAVILPATPLERAVGVAERIRAAVEAAPVARGEVLPGGHLTISIGVASSPEDGVEKADLLRAADDRLYAAKRAGKNRVVALAP
jgi:diguanylate cyclase (GGDEF)-like protein